MAKLGFCDLGFPALPPSSLKGPFLQPPPQPSLPLGTMANLREEAGARQASRPMGWGPALTPQ